jgi:hypothetical protein
MIDSNFELMFDSGAFTAWSKGEEVTLEHLIPVYEGLLEKYDGTCNAIWLISLDKIPGGKGRTATPQEIHEAIRISDENFYRLVDRFGPRVLPVFHQNESDERLLEVSAMSEYICVSPRNDLPERARVVWSREVHTLLPKGKNTHGLAATGYEMMTTVPWGSVDAASWLLIAAYGGVYVDRTLRTLAVSEMSPQRHEKNNHFRTLRKHERDLLAARFAEKGFTVEEMETDFVPRAIWNRVMMSELYRSVTEIKQKAQISLWGI